MNILIFLIRGVIMIYKFLTKVVFVTIFLFSSQIFAVTAADIDNANAEDRRNMVSDDYAKTHISAQLRNKGSYEYTHFFEQVQLDLDSYFLPLRTKYPELSLSVTGQLALMMGGKLLQLQGPKQHLQYSLYYLQPRRRMAL